MSQINLLHIQKINEAISSNPDSSFEDICDAIGNLTTDACTSVDCPKCPLYANRLPLEKIQTQLDAIDLIYPGEEP